MKNAERRMRNGENRRLTLVSAVLLTVFVAVSLVTLPFSLQWYNVQDLDRAVRHSPAIAPVVPYERGAGTGDTPLTLDSHSPQYVPHSPGEAPIASPLAMPSTSPLAKGGKRGVRPSAETAPALEPAARVVWLASSWLGHDDLGRSLLFRVLPGFLVSLSIGLAAAGVAAVVGTAWGATAALFGGRIDLVMMRIVDVLFGLPYVLMVILLKIALTRPLSILLGGHTRCADIVILFLAIGGVSWLTMARVIRGQVLSLRRQPFVDAARVAGAGPVHILWWHVLPNMIGPMVTYAALVIPQAILQESFLSFLGIGVQQPTPSLGRLAADGVEAVNTFVGYWWLIVFPCGVLVLTLVTLNFIGDALRDAFDPKSKAATLV